MTGPDAALSRQEIFGACPLAYRMRTVRNPDEPRPPIAAFGIECGDGWLPIIAAASARIEAELRALTANGVPMSDLPCILQVKNKFGLLRMAVIGSNSTDEIRAAMVRAEEASAHICELCGKAGSLRRLGYMRTLCDEHWLQAAKRLDVPE